MPKTRKQKEESVQVMTDKLGKAKSVVFADYKGMTMSQLQELRKALKESGAEFTITKNNLVKLALKNNQLTVDDKVLEGPIATLFAYEDEISPIKTLVKTIKDNQIGKVKAGILDGETMDEYKVVKLSQLPSKDELRGKVVGVLVAPLHGLLNVTQGNLRNLVYALEQIRVQKGGE
jgi:large subunit ribosomal protein L10